jgi:hypothetical protein
MRVTEISIAASCTNSGFGGYGISVDTLISTCKPYDVWVPLPDDLGDLERVGVNGVACDLLLDAKLMHSAVLRSSPK